MIVCCLNGVLKDNKLCICLLYLCGPSNNFIIEATFKILMMMTMMTIMMNSFCSTTGNLRLNLYLTNIDQSHWTKT